MTSDNNTGGTNAGESAQQDPTQNPSTSSSDSTSARRRRMLEILGGGTVAGGAALLSGNWAAPVVRSVALPAHAQTTPGLGTVIRGLVLLQSNSGQLGLEGGSELYAESSGGSLGRRVLGSVVSSANATALSPAGRCIEIRIGDCTDQSSTSNVQIDITSSVAATETGSGSIAQLMNSGIAVGPFEVTVSSLGCPVGNTTGQVSGVNFSGQAGAGCTPIDDSGTAFSLSNCRIEDGCRIGTTSFGGIFKADVAGSGLVNLSLTGFTSTGCGGSNRGTFSQNSIPSANIAAGLPFCISGNGNGVSSFSIDISAVSGSVTAGCTCFDLPTSLSTDTCTVCPPPAS